VCVNYDALQGETDRLRKRISQMFERLETQLRQILRDHNMTSSTAPGLGSTHCANLLLACAEGRINQFVRTDFRALPTTGWDDQWQVLEKAVFN
jgi:TetR/AcrR family transcriptional regulator